MSSEITSIIVYRNPLEKAMWESFDAGALFPVMVAGLTFIAVTMLASRLRNRFRKTRGLSENWSLLAGTVAAGAVLKYMWI